MDLSNFFTTKAEAKDFYNRLATISEQIYHTNFSLEQTLLEQLGMQKQAKFLTFLRDNNIQITSTSALKTVLQKMQETIAALPVLTLTIAFEPKQQTLKAIAEWLQLNLHKQLLLDISVDPELIAGATISFNGKFADYSIKPIFEQIIKHILIPTQTQKPAPAVQLQVQPVQTQQPHLPTSPASHVEQIQPMQQHTP